MKLVVYVMNNTSKLDDFLHQLKEKEIKGATILDSTGMARKLIENDDMDFIGSLKVLFDNPRVESKTILMALEDEQVQIALDIVHQVAGDLSRPNTGIVFTVPIEYIDGLKK